MATVLIPWRGGDPDRERNLQWVLKQYEETGWTVVLAEGSPDGPWSKGKVLLDALERDTYADPIIVADADVWCDEVDRAVHATVSGLAGWAIPHANVYRLTQEGTANVLEHEGDPLDQPCQRPRPAMPGGGIVVAAQKTLEHVPIDPRFLGWGQEDESWGRYALRTLRGDAWRGEGTLIHLWHTPQERRDRRLGSIPNWRLMHKYRSASGKRKEMEELVSAARSAD